jgi:hypothetical protein
MVGPKGIKKKDTYHSKKRRPKSWIENVKKPKEGTLKNSNKGNQSINGSLLN